jgi:hypothetical protein
LIRVDLSDKMARMARTAKNQLSLLDDITAMDANESPYIGYSTRALVHCTLPYRTPRKPVPKGSPRGTKGDLLPIWVRKNGLLTVQVRAGYEDDGTMMEVPSGSRPRIQLAWIGEQVIERNARGEDPCRISLGKSLAGLMTTLGIADSGGSTGSRKPFLRQLRYLAGASIAIHWKDTEDPDHKTGGHTPITRSWNVRWGNGEPDSHPTEDSVLVLDPFFVDEILKRPVPVNMEAMRILQSSALQLDVYQWATERFFRLDHPIEVSFEDLYGQMGGKPFLSAPDGETPKEAAKRRQVNAKMLYDFKRDLIGKPSDPKDKGALGAVLDVYHDADIKVTPRGLRLFPSPVHVPLRGTHGIRRAHRVSTLPARRTRALQAAGGQMTLPVAESSS